MRRCLALVFNQGDTLTPPLPKKYRKCKQIKIREMLDYSADIVWNRTVLEMSIGNIGG